MRWVRRLAVCLALALVSCGGGGGGSLPVDGEESRTGSLEWRLQVSPPAIAGNALTASARRSLLPAGWDVNGDQGGWRFYFRAPSWDAAQRRFRCEIVVENRGNTTWSAPLLVLDGLVALNAQAPDAAGVRDKSVQVLPVAGGSFYRLTGSGGERSQRLATSGLALQALAPSPLQVEEERPALALIPDQLGPGERSHPLPLLLEFDVGLESVALRVHLDLRFDPSPTSVKLDPEVGRPLELPVRDGVGEWTLPGRGARYLFSVVAFGREGRTYPLQMVADVAGVPVSRNAPGAVTEISAARPLCDIEERLRAAVRTPRRQRISLRDLKEGEHFSYTLSIPGTSTRTVDAVVLRVGSIGVWATEAESLGRLSSSDLDRLLASFEDRIIPRERLLLGPMPDVNRDGLVLLFLSRRVNDVGRYGFFLPGDLLGSGAMEVLYSALPDQRVSLESIESTMAHELQHIYHYYYTVIRRQEQGESAPFTPSTPINEGMSFLMEELTGFGDESASGRAKAWEFLQRGPERTSVYGADADGDYDNKYQRGMTYLLLRYLFEQAGGVEWQSGNRMVDGGGADLLQQLLRLHATGLTALDHLSLRSAGRSYFRLFQDWALALALDGLSGETEPYCFDSPILDPDTGALQGIDLRGRFLTSDTHQEVVFTGPQTKSFQGLQSELTRIQSHSVGYTVYQAPATAERVHFRFTTDAVDDSICAWVIRQR